MAKAQFVTANDKSFFSNVLNNVDEVTAGAISFGGNQDLSDTINFYNHIAKVTRVGTDAANPNIGFTTALGMSFADSFHYGAVENWGVIGQRALWSLKHSTFINAPNMVMRIKDAVPTLENADLERTYTDKDGAVCFRDEEGNFLGKVGERDEFRGKITMFSASEQGWEGARPVKQILQQVKDIKDIVKKMSNEEADDIFGKGNYLSLAKIGISHATEPNWFGRLLGEKDAIYFMQDRSLAFDKIRGEGKFVENKYVYNNLVAGKKDKQGEIGKGKWWQAIIDNKLLGFGAVDAEIYDKDKGFMGYAFGGAVGGLPQVGIFNIAKYNFSSSSGGKSNQPSNQVVTLGSFNLAVIRGESASVDKYGFLSFSVGQDNILAPTVAGHKLQGLKEGKISSLFVNESTKIKPAGNAWKLEGKYSAKDKKGVLQSSQRFAALGEGLRIHKIKTEGLEAVGLIELSVGTGYDIWADYDKGITWQQIGKGKPIIVQIDEKGRLVSEGGHEEKRDLSPVVSGQFWTMPSKNITALRDTTFFSREELNKINIASTLKPGLGKVMDYLKGQIPQ